jgi:hypothetical protein
MLLGDHKLTAHEFGRAKLYDAARKNRFKCILERRHPGLLNEKSHTLTAYYTVIVLWLAAAAKLRVLVRVAAKKFQNFQPNLFPIFKNESKKYYF